MMASMAMALEVDLFTAFTRELSLQTRMAASKLARALPWQLGQSIVAEHYAVTCISWLR